MHKKQHENLKKQNSHQSKQNYHFYQTSSINKSSSIQQEQKKSQNSDHISKSSGSNQSKRLLSQNTPKNHKDIIKQNKHIEFKQVQTLPANSPQDSKQRVQFQEFNNIEIENDGYDYIENEHSKFMINESQTKVQINKKSFNYYLDQDLNISQECSRRPLIQNKSSFFDLPDQSNANIEEQKNYENSEFQAIQNNFNHSTQNTEIEKQQQQIITQQQEKNQEIDIDLVEYQQAIENNNQITNSNYSLEIKVKHNFYWVKQEVKLYKNKNRFLKIRKMLFYLITNFKIISYNISKSNLLDIYEISVTLTNILILLNRDDAKTNQTYTYQYLLLILYFIDQLIHLVGQGLKEYAKNFWNIYDLIILILYFLFVYNKSIIPFDVSTFRLIRIPFYLGRMSIKLRIMLISIRESLNQIIENYLILLLFTVLLALVFLYAFNGVIRYRCMYETLGIFQLTNYENGPCGFIQCEQGFICSRQISNIDSTTNFDDMIFSYFQTIRTSVINDWTISMYILMKQFHPIVCIYFVFIIFAIDKFGFQLVIAVLKCYYHRTQEYYQNNPLIPEFHENQISIDLRELIQIGIWDKYKIISKLYKENNTLEKYLIGNSETFFKTSTKDINQVEKQKLLSARQNNQLKNLRSQMKEQYSYQSWISKLIFPDHQLQEIMHKIIDKNETNFKSLDLYFSFRSMDYLSLITQPKKQFNYITTSDNDILIQIDKDFNNNYNIMFQQYDIKYYQKKIIKPKQQQIKLPIKNTQRLKSLESIRQFNDEPYIYESQITVDYKQKKYDIKSQFQEIYTPKTQQQTKNNIGDMQSSVAKIDWIMLEGQMYHYDELKQILQNQRQFDQKELTDYQILYNNQLKFDNIQHQLKNHNWSGNDLLQNYQKTLQILRNLNFGWKYIFSKGQKYKLLYFQHQLYKFITFPFSQIIIDSLICINIIIVAISNYVGETIASYCDLFVNIILIIELMIKIICIPNYLLATYKVLEGLLIIMSTFEIIYSLILNTREESKYQILIYIRILKSLFFLRVIKYNKFASDMMIISQKAFYDYVSMSLLLFFLILNYGIVGMQIFDFPDTDPLALMHYFGDVYQSFMAVYNVATGDDWYSLAVLSVQYGNEIIGFLYTISMIFILNYSGFGLSLVIILDSFSAYLENIDELYQENVNIEQEHLAIQTTLNNENEQSKIIHEKDKTDFTFQDVIKDLILPEDQEKYLNIQCKDSLFIFSKQNQFRINCYLLTETILYKIFMQIITWGSLINLIVITYYDVEDLQFWNALEILKFLFNFIIFIDGLLQMIALGAFSIGGYFHSTWMILDFIYVIIYFFQLIFNHTALDWILFLGYLRPLKVTSYSGFFINERGAIMNSLTDILATFYVVLLFWFIFAIFGMTIFKDKMGYCDNYFNYGVSKQDCQGEWIIYVHNFDNIINSMETLYIMSTLDGWGLPFFICINSNISEEGPIRFKNEWPTYIFFFLYTFVGAMFFLQFFAGILFVNYSKNKSQLLNPDLTLDQDLFLKLSENIMIERPNYSKPAKRGIRLKAKQLLQSCLFINLFSLMLLHETASNKYLEILDFIHHSLTILFFMDCLIKLATYHIKRYFDDSWRKVEFFFSIIGLLDLFLDINYNWFIHYMRAPRNDPLFLWLRIFSLNRCLRMILIVQLFTRIRKLLNVIYFNKMTILRLLGLFLTIISCYSYIGCKLYPKITTGEFVGDQSNFSNFFYGLIILFKCITEDAWRNIFTDTVNNSQGYSQPWYLSAAFFYSLIFIGARIMMNLIVCEFVQEFERFYDTSSSCIETYLETIDKYRNLWCKYSEDYLGDKIDTKYLAHFLLELGEPLGAQQGDNIWDAAKQASNFQLKKDPQGCISFKNLLYEVFKNSFREQIYQIGTTKGKQIMKQNDKKVKYRLYNQRDTRYRREVVSGSVVDLQSNFNILQEYLYLYMSLKAWKTYCRLFFQDAECASQTINYSDSNLDQRISEYEDFDSIEIDTKKYFKSRRNRKFPSTENLRRPTDVYILPYYEEQIHLSQRTIATKKSQLQQYQDDCIILKPSDQKQQNKLKSVAIIKKKEQFIKTNDLYQRKEGIEKLQFRNRYLYGYHDKMILKQTYEETTADKIQSRGDIMKIPSGYNITKIGSRFK